MSHTYKCIHTHLHTHVRKCASETSRAIKVVMPNINQRLFCNIFILFLQPSSHVLRWLQQYHDVPLMCHTRSSSLYFPLKFNSSMHDNKVTLLQQNGIQSVNSALYVIPCAIQLVTGNLIKMISTPAIDWYL